jgi:hypothetical protein
MKRLFILIIVLFYGASAFAGEPWRLSPSMSHGVAAAVTEHHDCDDGNATAAVGVNRDDEDCADCTRGFSPCCTGMFALTTVGASLASPAAVADRTPHIATLQLSGRSESIYRPPRA